MNRRFHFYDKVTGRIHDVVVMTNVHDGAEEFARLNAPNGHEIVEGDYDAQSQRIDTQTGNIVDWQPPKPSADHEWQPEIRRWQLNANASEIEAKRREARQRIAALSEQERHLMRRLMLNESDVGSRQALEAIDAEISHLLNDKTNP